MYSHGLPVLGYFQALLGFTIGAPEGQFKVLKITNTPFPSSSTFPATLNSSFEGPVAEFTACFRFQIESYNELWLAFLEVKREEEYPTWFFFQDYLGWNTGTEVDGLQSAHTVLRRNIPGGGYGGGVKSFPGWHMYHMPFKVPVSKWFHSCVSYSSIKQTIHKFINGLKAFSFKFTDKEELPLPAGSFQHVKIAQNMRGMFSDLQIYSSYFNTEAMIAWTTACTDNMGDIINWNKDTLNIMENREGPNATILAIDRKDICPNNLKPITMQKAKETSSTKRIKRYKRSHLSGSFVNSVLVLFHNEDLKDNMDCVDQCLRFSGELMNFPQNQVIKC